MPAAPQKMTREGSGWLTRELSATFALSWPIILANVANMAMTATDTIFLGRLSPNALAAGALGFNLYQPAFLLGLGVVAALSPIAAAKLGAGQGPDALRRACHQSLLSSFVISAATWMALWWTTPILIAIGEPSDLARDAGIYMRGFQWSLAPSLLFFSGRSLFSALERPRPPLIAGLIGVAFNAFANDALIFGKFGAPALGIIGSGLATTLSQTLMFALIVVFAMIDPRMRAIKPFALPWRPDLGDLAALWKLGLPIGATITAEVGLFSAATLVMGLLGPATLEAHTVALQVAAIAFMVPLGLGQAASIRIGRAFGARDAAGVARAGWSAFGLTVAYAIISAAAMVGAPRLLISPYLNPDLPQNAEAVAIAFSLLKVAALFQIVDGSQATLANMLRGLHDSRWPLVIALVGYWAIGAPVGVALGFATPLGGVGVWIGLATGLATVAALYMVRWIRKERAGFWLPAVHEEAAAAAVSLNPGLTS